MAIIVSFPFKAVNLVQLAQEVRAANIRALEGVGARSRDLETGETTAPFLVLRFAGDDPLSAADRAAVQVIIDAHVPPAPTPVRDPRAEIRALRDPERIADAFNALIDILGDGSVRLS